MKKFSLDALARHLAAHAAVAPSGRSAETVYGGHEHVLRQTLVALQAGRSMAEHESPGEATVYILRGRIRVVADRTSWDGRSGDLIALPRTRHRIDAVTDTVALFTVAKY
ncbi:LuxR family transcriptional regulator [Rhodococcus sp. 14C212]|uniref:cupin domain-containing protein n=1 Tax=Rhodococcus sp. 14C212 TaxID=2711209 RepID=UPI0013EC9832|nr:cupin domain-containing protein [Rhodococcus sp. 14C212]NGP08749.1 LuxR family transcriptional regulator [Rhodococcus sp. 14C212]